MSRRVLHLDPGDEGESRSILLGYDPPFKTFFAALYEGLESEGDEIPTKAFGYHPAERGCTPPGTEYGVYPADLDDFDRELKAWGLGDGEREAACAVLATDPDCPARTACDAAGGRGAGQLWRESVEYEEGEEVQVYAVYPQPWWRRLLRRAPRVGVQRMTTREPSIIKEGGYQGSSDPGRPTSLMRRQLRPAQRSPRRTR